MPMCAISDSIFLLSSVHHVRNEHVSNTSKFKFIRVFKISCVLSIGLTNLKKYKVFRFETDTAKIQVN